MTIFLLFLTNCWQSKAVDIDVVGVKQTEGIVTAFIYNANTKRSKDLSATKIDRVNATYPQGMDASMVQDLLFFDQETKIFPFDLFRHFPAVRLLQVIKSFQDMESPIEGNFIAASRLEKVFITNQAFIRMGSNVFEGATEIKWIYLEHNLIQSIDEATFRDLKTLEKLSLQSNRISSLANGTFSTLTELQFLNLRNNLITTINSNMFARNKKLDTILIDINRLLFIPSLEIPREISAVQLSDNLCIQSTFHALDELNQALARNCFIFENPDELVHRHRQQSVYPTNCNIRDKESIVELKDGLKGLEIEIRKLEEEKARLNDVLEATSSLQVCHI